MKESIENIAAYNEAYERFKVNHLTADKVLPFSLTVLWEQFNWETRTNILSDEIDRRSKEDPTFEMWIRSPSYSWIGMLELLPIMLSNKGRLYSLKTEQYLILDTASNGQVYCEFQREWMMIARAVATNFIAKEKELERYVYSALTVEHKNGVLHDNSSLNLKWGRPSDEVLESFNSLVEGKPEQPYDNKCALITTPNHGADFQQFVLIGTKAIEALGLDPVFIYGCTVKMEWNRPFRARYIGIGEAMAFPQTPPEGFNIESLKPPAKPEPDPWEV